VKQFGKSPAFCDPFGGFSDVQRNNGPVLQKYFTLLGFVLVPSLPTRAADDQPT